MQAESPIETFVGGRERLLVSTSASGRNASSRREKVLVMRKAVVGVMGGAEVDADVRAMAKRLGELIAARGWILLNGGRNTGVMDASAEGAKGAGGTVVGILPDRDTGRASAHLDVAVVTGLGDGRYVINVLSSDVVVACPGALGTLSEISFALKNGKRVVLLAREVGAEFEPYRRGGQLTSAPDPERAVEQVAAALGSKAE